MTRQPYRKPLPPVNEIEPIACGPEAITDNLKPCPFCGGQATMITSSKPLIIVECETCFAKVSSLDGLADAIAAWNRRPEDLPMSPGATIL